MIQIKSFRFVTPHFIPGCVPETSGIVPPAHYMASRIIYPASPRIPVSSRYSAASRRDSVKPKYLSFKSRPHPRARPHP